MGGQVYRESSFRQSINTLKNKKLLLLLVPGIGFLFLFFLFGVDKTSNSSDPQSLLPEVRPVEGVAALGQLTPSGEVRKLAAPVSGFGGTPRISELLVSEGEIVRRGQVLAIFDNRPKLLADLDGIRARIKTLDIKIRMQEREVERYKKVALEGAAAIVLLEEKEDELVKLEGEQEQAFASLKGLQADIADSELKAPIDGVVLRIMSRVGERPSIEGVMEVGATHSMEALIEVYESDIGRIKLGQRVSLTSENGGFQGTLLGRVSRISPQVRQRKVLSTDPTGDSDARVIEVRVILESTSAALVKHLTGMKVIARFQAT